MEKKSDKKTIIILVIILAISIIGGGIWIYNTSKPLETTVDNLENVSGLKIEEVFAIKNESVKNIEDFLQIDTNPGSVWTDLYTKEQLKDTIWEDLYNDPQFNSLQDTDIKINIDNYLNNSNPFVLPPSIKK